MSYLDNREIREIFYKSNVTKASELSNDGKFDNSKIIDEILELRAKRSEILGFKNYAEYSLARKMANNTEEVVSFLEELALRAKLIADKELSELEAFAKKLDNLDKLEPWDATYYSTLYQKINYDFSEEDIRPYFPEDKVFTGLSKLVENIFGITITEIKDFTKWHDTVKLFEVRDDEGNLRGKFYSDLYARDYKRSGAWMADLRSRMLHANGDLEYPIAFLEGNFTPPSKEKPALLSHSEVNVLFHEVGHTLQHVLTQVNYSGVAGINGIEYDAIELPSQFMENWCWEREVIDDISGHFETGEKLPNAEYDKLIALKNYQSAMQMVRQIEFALFDFRIHMKEGLDANLSVQEILNDVRSKVAVMKPKEYNRFQHAFSHIFAGGYAAGYYSYKWAEVLSSDAFSKFEEVGKFDKATGKLFRETILEQGGSKPAMDIFIEFRGRKPSIDALLRHNGI
jgi:oligopeptidase A